MRKELIVQRSPKSPITEVFRTLRTNIQFMNSQKKLKTILITSTMPGEGKSFISSNLAITFAQTGKRVVLIDADMRKGRLHTMFSTENIPGLSNYLSGIDQSGMVEPVDILKYIRNTEIDNLFLISAGNVPPNPAELLSSELTLQMLEKLKEVFDVIIIDATPSILVTDAIILSRLVDSTIIVASHNYTKKDNLQKVKRAIENVGGKIAGVVINKIPVNVAKYEASYYYNSTAMVTTPNKKKDTYKDVMIENYERPKEISMKKQQEIMNELSEFLKNNR